jgi:hypothetical protein
LGSINSDYLAKLVIKKDKENLLFKEQVGILKLKLNNSEEQIKMLIQTIDDYGFQ